MIHPIKHFKTITHHRHLVIKYSFYCGIFWQGLRHDLSKYSPREFNTGAKYYSGVRSPNSIEIEKIGYSLSWLHHKGRNKHHFEYWTVYSKVEKKYVPIKMPLNYVKEMLCDRIAATVVYNGKNYKDYMPLEYFETRNDSYGMHEDTAKLIRILLTWVKDLGWKEALKKVKKVKEY